MSGRDTLRLCAALLGVCALTSLSGCGLMRSLAPIAEAPALEAFTDAELHDRSVRRASKPLRALFVLSPHGTEVFDLLAPLEVLAESGHFEVATVAASLAPVPLTGRIAVLPDHRFSDAPEADVIVIPAVVQPDDPALVGFVRERGARARIVLSVCEGARVVARSGLLDQRRATSHFFAIDSLASSFQQICFAPGHRYVWDEPVLSSAGVSAALDASLEAVALLVGEAAAFETAARLGAEWHRESDLSGHEERASPYAIGFGDGVRLLSSYLQPWGKRRVALWLRPGSSEIAIAAVVDALPRTLRVEISSVSDSNAPVRTRHGMRLVANTSWATLTDVDEIIAVGPEAGARTPRGDEPLVIGAPLPGRALAEVLDYVAERVSPGHRKTVATLLEHPLAIR